ncbi:hypothetical protein B0H19DRAFT_1058460 [Mycena capillaripes]|nr:hypothetical protein B0H19DRAFT_1058460 [Mycena capillaripes]
MVLPPLLADTEGHYRVHLVGNSGTGKESRGSSIIFELHKTRATSPAYVRQPYFAEGSIDLHDFQILSDQDIVSLLSKIFLSSSRKSPPRRKPVTETASVGN